MKGVREVTRTFRKTVILNTTRCAKNDYVFLSFEKNFSTDLWPSRLGQIRNFSSEIGENRHFFALGIGPNSSKFNLTKLVHMP